MKIEEVKAAIRKAVSEVLSIKPETIRDDDDFIFNLGADSLDILDISLDVEDELEIDIPGEKLKTERTINSLAEYILSACVQPQCAKQDNKENDGSQG